MNERQRELAQMPYQEYLRSPEWAVTRSIALNAAGMRCQICNGDQQLQVHHRTYERRGHENLSDLTVLCDDCHQLFHDHRKLSGSESGGVLDDITKTINIFTRGLASSVYEVFLAGPTRQRAVASETYRLHPSNRGLFMSLMLALSKHGRQSDDVRLMVAPGILPRDTRVTRVSDWQREALNLKYSESKPTKDERKQTNAGVWVARKTWRDANLIGSYCNIVWRTHRKVAGIDGEMATIAPGETRDDLYCLTNGEEKETTQ